MARIRALQLWLIAFLLVTIPFAERGDVRLHAPLGQYYARFEAYRSRDRTGEILFLGSSVIGCGVIPRAIDDGLRSQGIKARSYCLFLDAGLPPTYRTVMRDVIARQGRPRMLVLGVSPRDMNDNSPRLETYVEHVASLADAWALISAAPLRRHGLVWPLVSRPPAILVQMALVREHDTGLIARGLKKDGARWWYEDSPKIAQRNAELAQPLTDRRYRMRVQSSRSLLAHFASEDSERWLRATVEDVQNAGIPVALCLFDYSSRAQEDLAGGRLAETARVLERISKDYGVPLWRTTSVWPAAADASSHFRGVDHLSPTSAMAFSRVLGAGALAEALRNNEE